MRMNQEVYRILTVERTRRETASVTSVFLRGDLGSALENRRAGQFMTVRLPQADGWSKPHPYTISNAPEDPCLQLTAKAVGPFSTSLQSIPAGTTAAVDGPFGTFCRDIEQAGSVVLIAGGIGITPFLSVLRHYRRHQIQQPVTLFWANNTAEDFFCLDELETSVRALSLQIILSSLSPWPHAPSAATSSKMTRTQGYLTSEVILRHCQPTTARTFLCGSENMQSFALRQLATCGVPADQVETERFGVFDLGPALA